MQEQHGFEHYVLIAMVVLSNHTLMQGQLFLMTNAAIRRDHYSLSKGLVMPYLLLLPAAKMRSTASALSKLSLLFTPASLNRLCT